MKKTQTDEEWEWTIKQLENEVGYKTETVAAYKSPRNGVVVPVDFADNHSGKPPETIETICGTRWGGSGEVEEMELVSDGFIE